MGGAMWAKEKPFRFGTSERHVGYQIMVEMSN